METIMEPGSGEEKEFLKGEVSGMFTAIGYPDILKQQMEAVLKFASKEELES